MFYNILLIKRHSPGGECLILKYFYFLLFAVQDQFVEEPGAFDIHLDQVHP